MPAGSVAQMQKLSATRGEYRKSAGRREEILDAAFDVFSRVGYLNASVTEIAKQANFTLPGLSHHFPSKASLFEAVVHRRDVDASHHLAGRTGIDLIRGLVEIARRDEADTKATRMFAIISAEAGDPEHPMHAYFARRYDFILRNVTSALEVAQAAGELGDGITPSEAARMYVALSDGFQLQSFYDGTHYTETLRIALQALLRVSL